MQTILPIDQLAGKMLGEYQIERLLNHGKLGTAYLARKHGDEQFVMITLFPLPETFSDRARNVFGSRFLQESQKLIRLRHAQLLPLYTYGQYSSYPYLVSAFMKGRSLAQILKQQPRFTLQQAAQVLRQMAVVLDYLHQRNMIHGLLNPTSILVDNNQKVQLAGVGLRSILEMYGIEIGNHPYAHLYSVAETFLGAPEYLAPECVGSNPLDARADLYSLALILFEMLTGRCLFTGKDQVEVVLQRLQQPVPSLRSISADLPIELDLVMQKALHTKPAQRFQSAGEMASAFEHIVQAIIANGQRKSGAKQSPQESFETTLPPTVNWFDANMPAELPGQDVPPVTMGYLSSIGSASSTRIPAQQRQAPVRNNQPVAGKPAMDQPAVVYGAADPFELWSANSAKLEAQIPDTHEQSKKTAAVSSTKETKKQTSTRASRRKVVALLATGGVAVVGLGLGGASLAHVGPFQQATTQKQQASTTDSTTKTITTTNKQTTPKQATKAQHTGTVIGKDTQTNNTAIAFNNPADGNQSLLIRLPNGNFVAAERACTHAGVAVNYDAATQKLVCPLHGSVFDPANKFNVLKGPAGTPLKAVAIHVNGDGTITV